MLILILFAIIHCLHLKNHIGKLTCHFCCPPSSGSMEIRRLHLGIEFNNIDTDTKKAICITPPGTASIRLSIDPQEAPRVWKAVPAIHSRSPASDDDRQSETSHRCLFRPLPPCQYCTRGRSIPSPAGSGTGPGPAPSPAPSP